MNRKEDVEVANGRDGQRIEFVDAFWDAWAIGEGHRAGGGAHCVAGGLAMLALQAPEAHPLGGNTHPDLPEEALNHGKGAGGIKVARRRSMARVHYPRARV